MIIAKTLWGVNMSERDTWDSTFSRIKNDGFNAIEMWVAGPFQIPKTEEDEKYFQSLQKKYSFKVIAQVHTCDYPVSSYKVQDHIEDYKKKVTKAQWWPDTILINCHSGKDSFTQEEALQFFQAAAEIETTLSIPVVHETHRQRILYSPFVMRDLMNHKNFPESINFNADLSHFVVVCERTFDNELDPFFEQLLEKLSERCRLIHCRVGYSQGPQVPEPCANEFAPDVEKHMSWWHVIMKGMQKRKIEVIVEPEFGPESHGDTRVNMMDPNSDYKVERKNVSTFVPGYAHSLPFTGQALADVWKVNTEMARRLKATFGEEFQ